jgi:hypothetical protein
LGSFQPIYILTPPLIRKWAETNTFSEKWAEMSSSLIHVFYLLCYIFFLKMLSDIFKKIDNIFKIFDNIYLLSHKICKVS